MFEHLRRLATTGAAYTAASVLSKLIALFLLPIYTAYLSPADYGAAEVMLASLVAASIVVRLGVIEAILRFYYLAGEKTRKAVVRTAFASLFWTTTIAALIALPFAGEISEALLEEEDAGLARLAILGLWHLTLWEFVLTLLRLDERARLYFTYTIAQVLVTIPVTVALVVGTDLGASAILLGSFGTGVFFLAGPPVGRAPAARASLRDAAASPDAPLRAADDAGRADALLALLPRPHHHRPPRRPRRGGPVRARCQVRERDAGPGPRT